MEYAHENEDVSETGTKANPPRLMDEVQRRIRVKHYILRTEQAYTGWIRRFLLANGKRHPRELGKKAGHPKFRYYPAPAISDFLHAAR